MGSLAVIVFGRVSWSRPRERHDRASGIRFPGDKRSGDATDRSIDKKSSIVIRRERGDLEDGERSICERRTILSATLYAIVPLRLARSLITPIPRDRGFPGV
jgi:hypothetical protein